MQNQFLPIVFIYCYGLVSITTNVQTIICLPIIFVIIQNQRYLIYPFYLFEQRFFIHVSLTTSHMSSNCFLLIYYLLAFTLMCLTPVYMFTSDILQRMYARVQMLMVFIVIPLLYCFFRRICHRYRQTYLNQTMWTLCIDCI